ncbi:MAG: serine/threonine protein kinase [Rhizobacter sp.]|nr:serine/threonine protein kinase [Rhizobacter sp.]
MTVVGPYTVESEIARGATSVVHLARDGRDRRCVALKTIALGRELSGEALTEARARFLREAAAARRLDHPDIVKILDAGEERGVAYLAMELLPGHDLQPHVDPGQLLPVPQALRIAARVADALAHAHRQGVVHRDIKPGNVIVDAATDRVVVTDFGVARIGDASHTRTGMLLGTPAYMSPEQLVGQRVDGRSDLYALGVLLFQLLCGRLPFEAATLAAMMKQIVNDAAPPLRSLNPDLPEALEALVARMLAKDRASRPGDGAEIAQSLRAIATQLDGSPGRASAAG